VAAGCGVDEMYNGQILACQKEISQADETIDEVLDLVKGNNYIWTKLMYASIRLNDAVAILHENDD